METPFDQLISNQNLQMLKLLIPYTPPETQRFLAVYVKFSELQYTLDFFQNFRKEIHAQDFERKILSPVEIIQEIRPYLPAQITETLDSVQNMMDMIDLFKTFQEMPASDDNTGSGFDPMSMMKNMLTPEQQSMFDMYNSMLNQQEMKGDDSDD